MALDRYWPGCAVTPKRRPHPTAPSMRALTSGMKASISSALGVAGGLTQHADLVCGRDRAGVGE
jgi:hypothetical protein